jgi:protein-tyrosine phosphatase
MKRNSISDPLRIADVASPCSDGLIGVTFCPGKKDPHAKTGAWDRDLDLDLDVIECWGARAVVTLLTSPEIAKLGVQDLGNKVAEREMSWFHFPIDDGGVPDAGFEQRWKTEGAKLRAIVRNGGRILIHCRGGLGRSGTIAGRLLVELGMEGHAAIELMRKARHGAIETLEQEGHVLSSHKVLETIYDLTWPLVIPPKRLSKAHRYARNVLLMVQELHMRGYQRLRIVPGFSGTGLAWRCGVTSADNISKNHGAIAVSFDDALTPQYSSASENVYFGWKDATLDKPQQLADKFLEKFPLIARRGAGFDYTYAGWFSLVISISAYGIFPVAFNVDAYESDEWLPSTEPVRIIPMPPVGESERIVTTF